MEDDMTLAFRVAIAAVVILVSPATSAEGQVYDDWAVGATDNGQAVYAATTNDSGSILAQFCYFGQSTCEYRLLIDSRCTDGNKYPGLLNSDAGASSITLVCDGSRSGDRYAYVVGPFDNVDKAIRKGTRIGFVIPMQRDEFKAMRYSLRGSNSALTFMRSAYSRAEQSGTATPRPARDSRL
jgi:hypothetical protein